MVFPWRKKNDGFEWRTYVRTTILVRRHERRQRAEDVKAAAVFGIKQAGEKGANVAGAGLQAVKSGSLSAIKWSGRRLRSGFEKSKAGLAASSRKGAAGIKRGWHNSKAALAPHLAAASSAAGAAAARISDKLSPVTTPLRTSRIQLALKAVAALALLGTAVRWMQFGFDDHTFAALMCAALAGGVLAATGGLRPWQWLRTGLKQAGVERMRLPQLNSPVMRGAAFAVAGLLTLAGAASLWWHHAPSLSLPSFAVFSGSASPGPGRDRSQLEGTATARSGDRLAIAGIVVHLDGIEAPDRSQICSKPRIKRWDCAASARDALQRLTRGKRVACELTGETGSGARTGKCTAGTVDIASEMVRNGHVFASSGLFTTYGSQEAEAKDAKLGLWAGDAMRPKEWRAVRWAEAKSKAPSGCPIKGQVFPKSGKVYMLPWQPDYERARVDSAQGERWFCSESEAQSAGWKPL